MYSLCLVGHHLVYNKQDGGQLNTRLHRSHIFALDLKKGVEKLPKCSRIISLLLDSETAELLLGVGGVIFFSWGGVLGVIYFCVGSGGGGHL